METLTQNIQETTLSNGVSIPMVGLGVLKAKDGLEVESAVRTALQNGYRLIDTAAAYQNEAGVGNAIKASGIPRDEIFLTTKVWNSDQGYENTLAAFEHSLELLQTDYIDLYLIHWPVAGKYKDTWRALETLYKQGKVRAIGVSNFQVHHLEDLMSVAEITPMINQVETHPHLQQGELQAFAKAHEIKLEAWRPIMMGEVMLLPELREIAKGYQKSPAQITLRWLTQRGIIVIPKSVKEKRIVENADIFDFDLSENEMNLIASLDRGRRLGPDPDNFNF
ncbi:glyoxal reductase [Roseivirga sp. 4D4]|uniref:aldo/keto reductase n=1 Tax=Roseivirga sp. 4D4 TaxID=1889784 RepID=UPI000852FC81|nr:aldo/keto reductase [Roseivirga sp. 4D4]OEK01937.1 glyoxal reductase [Roseivirga sp. 4D4]